MIDDPDFNERWSVSKMRAFLLPSLVVNTSTSMLYRGFDFLLPVFGVFFLKIDFLLLVSELQKIQLSDVLFIVGAVLLGIGALTASGGSTLRTERPSTLYARPSGHVDFLIEQRKKGFDFGLVLMIIGTVLIVLSLAIYKFL